MLKAKIAENTHTVELDENNSTKGSINQQPFDIDVQTVKKGQLNIIRDGKVYNAEVLEADTVAKTFTIKINNNIHEVSISDKYDALLKQLGMDNLATAVVKEVKAPMPGLVHAISCEVGQEVKTGDSLLILEAMKMENIIKSPADGIVKKIEVSQGETVEKNQNLISFE